jgi:hypothetical protein
MNVGAPGQVLIGRTAAEEVSEMSSAITGQSRSVSRPLAQPEDVRRFRDREAHELANPMRRLGAWSARAMVVLIAAYIVVFVVGFADLGNTSKPLPDPYLAIAEILILIMAPIMVTLMLAIHHCAPPAAKPFTQVALGWMIAAAGLTTVVHFVELTVARHIDQSTFPGYARIFGFAWPSAFYAIDIVAWDVFFGLALLFAVPAFAHQGVATAVRRGLIASGSLCLIGLIGPFANALGWRTIGILGYTVVFGLTCLPLIRWFEIDRASDAPPRSN